MDSNSILWENCEAHCKKLFITKWLSGDTATGVVMCRRKQRTTSFCPRCGLNNEHLLHVIICSSAEAIQLREKLMAELIQWFKSHHTHPNITLFFQMGLEKWFVDQTYQWQDNSLFFSDTPDINTALHSQLQVSWYYMLCGMLTEILFHSNIHTTMR